MLIKCADWGVQGTIVHRLLSMSGLRFSIWYRMIYRIRFSIRMLLMLGIYWWYALLGSIQVMLHRDLLVIIIIRASSTLVLSPFLIKNL